MAVATEMRPGHEVWLKHGRIVDAMRASYALPGIFEPVKIGGRWLYDGAIINPVPVNVARAFGAEWVIALAIGGDVPTRHAPCWTLRSRRTWRQRRRPRRRRLAGSGGSGAELATQTSAAPGIASVMADTFNITQDRIMRSRLAGDPPDHMIVMKPKNIGLFEFHRAAELIELGRAAVRKAKPELMEQLEGVVTE